MDYMILYRKGRQLILFDFYIDDDCQDLQHLIPFHFEDQHDFDERIESCALSVFECFYEEDNGNEVELVGWEKKMT